jgi:CRISPR-associated protein Cas1
MTTLMLLSYGISVRKSSETLLIESKYADEETQEKVTQKIAVRQLTGVVCDSHVYISNPARVLLLSHSIPIVLLEHHRVIGVTHPFHSHGTVITRREQFIAFNDHRGVNLAKGFVQGPLNTKANLLLSYAKNRSQISPDLAEILTEAAHEIRTLAAQVPETEGDLSEIRNYLMGIEGQGTHLYYQAISQLLDPKYQFTGRQKRPPLDPINAALSYGYIILNSRCLIQTVTCGLDPYGGYLHVDRSGRPSLAIDLSEEFRQPIIDRAVFDLAISSQFDLEDDFSHDNDKILLTKSGKYKLFQKLEERFTTRLPYNGKHYTLEQIILLQVRQVIHYLLGKNSSYVPFHYGW